MLGIHMFRDNHELIRADHDKRGLSHDKIDQVIHFDQLWLSLQHQTNQLRQKKNTAAKGISEAKKSGDEIKLKPFWPRLHRWAKRSQPWRKKLRKP